MRLTVPRRGGWRTWVPSARALSALADPVEPAIASAAVASEAMGADYVRVTLALTVVTTDVADALMVAWDAFRSAARRYSNSRN